MKVEPPVRLRSGCEFLAGAGDGVHLRADRLRVAWATAERRLDDDGALGHLAVPISVAELLQRPFDDLAGSQHQSRRNKDVLHLAAVGAAVHADEAADGARNAAQELQPGNAGVAGRRGNENAAGAAPAAEGGLVDPLDLREGLAEPDHHAPYPAVADDEVRAQAERHHGPSRTKFAHELDQVVLIRRLEQPFGPAAALEPDQRRERRVRRELAVCLDQLSRSS